MKDQEQKDRDEMNKCILSVITKGSEVIAFNRTKILYKKKWLKTAVVYDSIKKEIVEEIPLARLKKRLKTNALVDVWTGKRKEVLQAQKELIAFTKDPFAWLRRTIKERFGKDLDTLTPAEAREIMEALQKDGEVVNEPTNH